MVELSGRQICRAGSRILTSWKEGIHTVEVGSRGCTWTFAHCPFKIRATKAAKLKRAIGERDEEENRAASGSGFARKKRKWVKQGP